MSSNGKAVAMMLASAVALGGAAGGAMLYAGRAVEPVLTPSSEPPTTPRLSNNGSGNNGTSNNGTSNNGTGNNIAPAALPALLRPFGTREAFDAFVATLGNGGLREGGGGMLAGGAVTALPAPSPAAAAESDGAPAQARTDDAITNTQVQGVDEGDIVKMHGDVLVVLRRGRLFTTRLGSDALTPISMIDAPPPGITGGWYDEMLISGNTIVVIGYNYQQTGTELGLFSINDQGQLSRRGTYYLRSGDYYSSRNYASRLLGSTLVFYMPVPLHGPGAEMPAMRRGTDDWRALIDHERVYQPIQQTPYHAVMHTIVRCDLAPTESGGEPACSAESVVGPASRNFYVSQSAVYLWVGGPLATESRRAPSNNAIPHAPAPDAVVYRMPLNGGAPGALQVFGQPTDQLSFDEAADGHLDVLVRSEGRGDAMWRPEVASGDIALTRLPIADMNAAVPMVSTRAYTPLPRVEGYGLQNRFVGDWVLYGAGAQGYYGARPEGASATLYAAPVRGSARAAVGANDPWVSIPLSHPVERIEVMGSDAVVVGADSRALHFEDITFEGANARIAGHYERAGASQGESRTHGFFYRQDSATSGVLGLPIRGANSGRFSELWQGSAGVLFLSVDHHQFREVGTLEARNEHIEDHCVVSCADWYGNARPIFWRGRTFALMGYELVEGAVTPSALREVRRVNFYQGARTRPGFGPIGQ